MESENQRVKFLDVGHGDNYGNNKEIQKNVG